VDVRAAAPARLQCTEIIIVIIFVQTSFGLCRGRACTWIAYLTRRVTFANPYYARSLSRSAKWDRRRYYGEIGESVRRSVCAKVCFGGRVRARTHLHIHAHAHRLCKLTLKVSSGWQKKNNFRTLVNLR